VVASTNNLTLNACFTQLVIANMQRTGTLKKFFAEKGFGFIAPDDGSPDLFAHKRALLGANEAAIAEGVKVSFQSEVEDRTGKPKATTWSIVGGDAAAMAGAMAMMGGPMPDYGGLAAASFGAARMSPYGMATPGMPMPGALPLGWEQVADPSTGKPYYCNRATGESSWTVPVAAAPVAPLPVAAPAGPALPPGWEQAPDPATGKFYYFNRATSETRWDPPPM
jgi:CspA family cold shock protein